MKFFHLKNEEALPDAASWFVRNMGDAKVFAISGELGAGKTTLIKAICEALEVKETVSSPTFALVYEYFSPVVGTIYHFDLYRIKKLSELFDLGYEDYFYSDKICLIEWPELAEDLLPQDACHVKIVVNQDESRKISLAE